MNIAHSTGTTPRKAQPGRRATSTLYPPAGNRKDLFGLSPAAALIPVNGSRTWVSASSNPAPPIGC